VRIAATRARRITVIATRPDRDCKREWLENGRRYFEYTMLYFVNAHELAHQWWGHQLIGSMTQGSNSMSETLAEDFAVKVMEKKYREENIREVFEIRIGSL
jgi:aminopeptidase N